MSPTDRARMIETEGNPKSIIYKGRMYLLASDGVTAPRPVDVDEEIRLVNVDQIVRQQERIKALESENQALKKDIDVMASELARYDVEENERLRAERDKYYKIGSDLQMDIAKSIPREFYEDLEAQLSEAVRLLHGVVDGIRREQETTRESVTGINAFLKSPLPSKLLERQRAKDVVVDTAKKLLLQTGINVLDCDDCMSDIEKEGHRSGCRVLALVQSVQALDALGEEEGK